MFLNGTRVFLKPSNRKTSGDTTNKQINKIPKMTEIDSLLQQTSPTIQSQIAQDTSVQRMEPCLSIAIYSTPIDYKCPAAG